MDEHTQLSDSARTEIENLLVEGRTIEAVKRYREATGAGLMDAVSAVEALAGTLAEKQPELTDGARSEIMYLLGEGHKIEAIRRYREATGEGLAEAKAAVEALAREGGMSPREPPPAPIKPSSGCAVLAVAVAVVSALAAALS